MLARKQAVAILLTVLVAAPVSPATGPSCSQVLDQIGTEARSFQAEAREIGMGFALDEALQPSLDAAKNGLEPGWNPTMGEREEALSALRAGKAKLDDWRAKVRTWSSQMADVQLCVEDPRCSLIELSNTLNDDLRQWVESLGPEGAASAAKRVNKAASLLQDYTSRLEGTAEGSVSSAVTCMDQNGPQQASSDPVDLRPSSPAQETPAVSAGKKRGGSRGKAAVVVLGGGLAAGAAILAGQAAANLANTTAGSCASNRFCVVSVMSSGCQCAGSVSGGCDWNGPTAGLNQSCGAGLPCANGLSCNNGRCEGSSGRCPF